MYRVVEAAIIITIKKEEVVVIYHCRNVIANLIMTLIHAVKVKIII